MLDPACGTGGFLRAFVNEVHTEVAAAEGKKWTDLSVAREKTRARLKAICDRSVFGIDFNPVLVRAAQMNLVMHGDGSSNVFRENSLLSRGEWTEETRTAVRDESFGLVVTNPPFGKDLAVDDPHVLGQYELPGFGRAKPRASVPPQELFLERCFRFLKKGGLLIAVTPDSILSNPSMRATRAWLLLRYQLLASISLPGEMFQPHTGTQTSLLVLKKRVEPLGDVADLQGQATSAPVFMSVPRRIGHDQRGSFLPARDECGDVVVREVARARYVRRASGAVERETYSELEPVADDQLPLVLEDFRAWLEENRHRL